MNDVKKSWQGRVLIAKYNAELKVKMQKLGIPPRDVTSANIIGTTEQCIEKICQYVDLGVTCFMFVFPEVTKDFGCLEEFSDKDMSQFHHDS